MTNESDKKLREINVYINHKIDELKECLNYYDIIESDAPTEILTQYNTLKSLKRIFFTED